MAGTRYQSMQRAYGKLFSNIMGTSSADSVQDANNPVQAPLIKFARYINGTLVLFDARTDSLDYVAFSHVWGPTEWRHVRGIPSEVKCSKEKADFIENDLPGMVGDGAFWMDTLTVNQRDQVEILAVVDAIPTIFRMAKKTIAIRECDGLYSCCMSAVDGFQDHGDFLRKLVFHARDHSNHVCSEVFLQRLWTLQECLLSHTIEFVVGKTNVPKKKSDGREFDPYYHQNELTTLSDSLWVLSHCFAGIGGKAAMIEFVRAYVHGGTVVNSRSPIRSHDEDLHTDLFLRTNLASHRSAEMPRDYVFATMPAFPWYHYPKHKAATMSFSEIYRDLYNQASNSGHAFTCKFPRSMFYTNLSAVEAWLPSPHFPDPTTLGDFLKMMGNRVPEASSAQSEHVHITTAVTVHEIVEHVSPEYLIKILEKLIKPFEQQWRESHLGGELSRYGNFPRSGWVLDHYDALCNRWIPLNPEEAVRVTHMDDETVIRIGPGLDYEEDNLLLPDFDLDPTTSETSASESAFSTTLFGQARQILDHMWCAFDSKLRNQGQENDWDEFKRQMRGSWSVPLLHSMLLLAAMVNCRIPLSAAGWVNKLFVPVMIRFGKKEEGTGFPTIGLLSKHARQPKSQQHQPIPYLSVGQHLPPPIGSKVAFGKDLFLVDPSTKQPVGLIPDLMPDDRTDEHWAGIACILYYGRCQYQGNGQAAFACQPLKTYTPIY